MATSLQARRQGIRDARLVDAAREGDARAFEALYERHHAAILSFCRHLTGRLEDAEDAVQHTFLSAHREIMRCTGELELKPWLYTVARNRCLSLLRARRVREGSGDGALWTGRHGPPEERPVEAWGFEGLVEEVERREDLRAIVADLGELPEPQRAALVLSELEALSHAEIAQVLRVDTAKVRSLVFQARSSLISTRDARDTACGEIRVQLSTLRGSSLRRRTLRRHVRACPGCREFEAAVRVQRQELALILPVAAGAGLRDAALPSAVASGATGGGAAATGGAAVGGAALSGSGLAAGGGGGVLSGLAGTVAGSGVAHFTAVVAVAATGTVGLAKAHIPQRLGIAEGGPHVERQAKPPSANAPSHARSPDAGAGEADAGGTTDRPGDDRPANRNNAEDAGHGRAHAPGQAKKASGHSAVPPGLAKKEENGGTPPGPAKQRKDGMPPGQARTPPGRVKDRAKPAPPGRAKEPAGGQPNNTPGGQPKKAPGGQSNGPGTPTPPGQAREPAHQAPPGQAGDPAKPTPPGQAKEPKPK